MTQHVAIIGAGWAGLAAAVKLVQRGSRVTLFEASRNLGGRARRISLDGQHLDNGQHILIGAYRGCLKLMREVGVDEEAALLRAPLELRYADGFCLRAPALPAPLHLGVALLRSPLSWRSRLAILRFMAGLRACSFRVDDELSVSALLAMRCRDEAACRYLWNPLCISALNTPPERASAAVFAAVLRDSLAGSRQASDLLIPRTDLGALLPEPAARFIEQQGGVIRLGAAVKRIRESGEGFVLDDNEENYSHVILATGPQHAGALLQDERLTQARMVIEALDYQPIVTCYLQYPATVKLPSPMLGYTGGLLQWLFDRGQLGGSPGLLAAVISAEGAHRELPQAELARRVHEEIGASAFGGGLPAPQWSRVITEKRATFSCDAGMRRPEMHTPLEGLLLAGDYVASDYPGTLESAVQSGIAAAAAITR